MRNIELSLIYDKDVLTMVTDITSENADLEFFKTYIFYRLTESELYLFWVLRFYQEY